MAPLPHVSSTVPVQVIDRESGFHLLTFATDLTPLGLFVRAGRPLPLGTRVTLLIRGRAPASSVQTVARVVRIHRGTSMRGMHLVFEPQDSTVTSLLAHLIEQQNNRSQR